MEMQQVRYFIAIAKTLNFTRAAEECHVTQPALTRAIKLLELELGGELIRREGRNTHLTELGKKMLPILRQCHDAALAAAALAKAASKGEVSTLTIAVAGAIDVALIISPLRELYPMFPGIQIKLKRGNAAAIMAMLKSGEVDLAMGGPLHEPWDRLEAWPMFSESFDLMVGADHQLATRNAIALDVELIREQQFLLHRGSDLTDYEIECLGIAGINLANAHEVESNHDLEALVASGFGVAIGPRHAMRSGTVCHLTLPGFDLERTIAVYAVAGRPKSRETLSLLSLLRGKEWNL